MPTKVTYANPPSCCDVCEQPVVDVFYDAFLRSFGCWGNVCKTCFGRHGVGLGTGRGQEFTHEGNVWVKTRG